jgi:hypothetical protein
MRPCPFRFTAKTLFASCLQVYRPKLCVLLAFMFTGQNPVCFLPPYLPAKTLCASCLQVYRLKPCVLLAFKFTGQNHVCFLPSSLPAKTMCASCLQVYRPKPCASCLQVYRPKPCVFHFHYMCYILPLLILHSSLWEEYQNFKCLVPRETTLPITNRTGLTLWRYTWETYSDNTATAVLLVVAQRIGRQGLVCKDRLHYVALGLAAHGYIHPTVHTPRFCAKGTKPSGA